MSKTSHIPSLPAYALFAAMLSAVGLPLYMHAPKFFVEEYGVSLAAMGAVLFALRLIDFVQDPLLGRLATRLQSNRAVSVLVAGLIMAIGVVGLFAAKPLLPPIWWFAIMLTLVFSAFSYLTICFYAQGVSAAGALSGRGHLQIARWRETGALLGICAAAVAPVAIGGYAGFAIGFCILTMLALWVMHTQWHGTVLPSSDMRSEMGTVIADSVARRLLLVALANSAPVAVSSTLFLFFVEDRLLAPGWEGPLLLLFFLSAAGSAPVWGRLAEKYGTRQVLIFGMVLSIVAFGYAAALGPGDIIPFGVICFASGVALGADMTLLPALFATRMAKIAPGAAEGFSLWSFVAKFTLAIAAISLLPLLDFAGYQPGQTNSEDALLRLSLLYGAVPCVLKLVAIALLVTTPNASIASLPTPAKERSAN